MTRVIAVPRPRQGSGLTGESQLVSCNAYTAGRCEILNPCMYVSTRPYRIGYKTICVCGSRTVFVVVKLPSIFQLVRIRTFECAISKAGTERAATKTSNFMAPPRIWAGLLLEPMSEGGARMRWLSPRSVANMAYQAEIISTQHAVYMSSHPEPFRAADLIILYVQRRSCSTCLKQC